MKVEIFKKSGGRRRELALKVKELEVKVGKLENELAASRQELEDERIMRVKTERALYKERKERAAEDLQRSIQHKLDLINNAPPINEDTKSAPIQLFGHMRKRSVTVDAVSSPSSFAYSKARQQEASSSTSLQEILDLILRPLKDEEVWALLFYSCALLSNLHTLHSVHGNISPPTIRITKQGEVRISHVPPKGKESEAIERFIAPENMRNTRHFPPSDVYSLGVSVWATADFMLEEEEEPDLSDELCELISRMTDDEQDNRPTIQQISNAAEINIKNPPNVLQLLVEEAERKHALRKEYEDAIIEEHRGIFRSVVGEMKKGVILKPINEETLLPPLRSPSLREELAKLVKGFDVWKPKESKPALHRREISQVLKSRLNGGLYVFDFNTSNSNSQSHYEDDEYEE